MTAEPADKKPETVTSAAEPLAAKKAAPVARKSARPAPRKKQRLTKAGKKAGKKPGGGKPAADEATSKAGLIRKVAGIIKAKGAKPRPSEIVKILGDEGVKVSAAQVSQTLKAAGYRPLRKRRKAKKPAAVAAAKKPGGGGRAGELSLDDLLAAKSVSGAFGGTDKAIAALEALKRLER